MKKSGNLKLFSLVFILTGALVFVGISLLDAQFPILEKIVPLAEEETVWNVTMPGSQTEEGIFCNLYGLPALDGYNTYKEGDDRVYVRVEKKKGGKEYLLRLFIYHSVYGSGNDAQCIDLDHPHQIGFQDLDLVNVPHSSEGYYVVPEEFPCFLPN